MSNNCSKLDFQRLFKTQKKNTPVPRRGEMSFRRLYNKSLYTHSDSRSTWLKHHTVVVVYSASDHFEQKSLNNSDFCFSRLPTGTAHMTFEQSVAFVMSHFECCKFLKVLLSIFWEFWTISENLCWYRTDKKKFKRDKRMENSIVHMQVMFRQKLFKTMNWKLFKTRKSEKSRIIVQNSTFGHFSRENFWTIIRLLLVQYKYPGPVKISFWSSTNIEELSEYLFGAGPRHVGPRGGTAGRLNSMVFLCRSVVVFCSFSHALYTGCGWHSHRTRCRSYLVLAYSFDHVTRLRLVTSGLYCTQ